MRTYSGKRISKDFYIFCARLLIVIFLLALLCGQMQIWILEDLALPLMEKVALNDPAFRAMDFSRIDMECLEEKAVLCGIEPEELLLCAMMHGLAIQGEVDWDVNYVLKLRNRMLRNYEDYSMLVEYLRAINEEMVYFPVADCLNHKPFVEFENSWGMERTFGGVRLHEGCDIMALRNERGLYPVVSVCDGVIENLGWLEKGGWRVGVRSASGIYYYYAHLAEYADIKIGDPVAAGDLLGFMGDSGYGKEGTVGMFDVHLHFGIYLYDSKGNEVSVNPYGWLVLKKNKVLCFEY
ncbi:MAG: peptidoglycan DD-metalloendopeptidase family protein [Lachnospiraceae bacterium]